LECGSLLPLCFAELAPRDGVKDRVASPTRGASSRTHLLPGGDLYEQSPTSSGSSTISGVLVAHLGPAVYDDPSLLWNAQDTPVPVSSTVVGNQLTIAPDSGHTGTFVIFVTVDDGHGGKASRSFKVTVS
jgi:hypothetical protein